MNLLRPVKAISKQKINSLSVSINTILVPVLLDNEHFSIVKQAGELAQEHIATIHLLLMPEITRNRNRPFIFRLLGFLSSPDISDEKALLFSNWKQYLYINYGVEVKCALNWGSWKKGVIKYAKNIRADLIVLKEQPIHRRFLTIGRSPVEFIIARSPCQVMTIFSKGECLAGWRQIVIPVTSFVPEKRIRTIVKLAKAFNFKILLIAIPGHEGAKTTPGFYFLTETLKLLKNAGNIQVECAYLKSNGNPAFDFLNYTKTHGGDALLTNRTNSDTDVVHSTENGMTKDTFIAPFYRDMQ